MKKLIKTIIISLIIYILSSLINLILIVIFLGNVANLGYTISINYKDKNIVSITKDVINNNYLKIENKSDIVFLSLIILSFNSLVGIFLALIYSKKQYDRDIDIKYDRTSLTEDIKSFCKNRNLIIIVIITILYSILINISNTQNCLYGIKDFGKLIYNVSIFNRFIILILQGILLILAVLWEEYLFRLVYFENSYFEITFSNNAFKIIFFNSLFFMLFHIPKELMENNFIRTNSINLFPLIYYFTFSFIFLSFVYLKTRNFFIVFFIHCIYNFNILIFNIFRDIFDKLLFKISFVNILFKYNNLRMYIVINLIIFLIFYKLLSKTESKWE